MYSDINILHPPLLNLSNFTYNIHFNCKHLNAIISNLKEPLQACKKYLSAFHEANLHSKQ